MDITIHSSFLPHDDPDASLAFYRDALGFEVRNDVGYQGMRWLTVGPVNQPDTNFVLTPAGVGEYSEADQAAIKTLMESGNYGYVILASTDLDATFARLKEQGAEVVQEVVEQAWGSRDCVFRDPANNVVRIQAAQG